MEMDLVVTRNLQLFIRMAELPCSVITSRMQWQIEKRLSKQTPLANIIKKQ